jgi:uncharacterized protein (TIGR02271 family)
MTTQELPRLQGQTVFDNRGQRIGEVQRVFYDQATNEASWITVPGPGRRETFIPMPGSRVDPSGVTVAVSKDVVEASPMVQVDAELSGSEAAELNRYYTGMLSLAPEPPSPEHGQPGELTAYEERVRVGTETVDTGSVRLHKSVANEPVQTSVPVRHEEARIERTPADAAAPTPGHRFEEESVEVTLHEDRPIVAKETVPVETVRLSTETQTDQRQVADQVRRERIEVEDQPRRSSRR